MFIPILVLFTDSFCKSKLISTWFFFKYCLEIPEMNPLFLSTVRDTLYKYTHKLVYDDIKKSYSLFGKCIISHMNMFKRNNMANNHK